jgi:nucleotide-binding universal stress UspA family protein
MSQKILLPLDGSVFGEAALHHVEELVSRLALEGKLEVILFQAFTSLTRTVAVGDEETTVTSYTESELERIKARAMDYLNKAAECLRGKGIPVRCEVTFGGSSAEEIIKAEDEFKADLVAMSTHGRHGITRWAFGSVTDKVLRKGTTPVLLVRVPNKG